MSAIVDSLYANLEADPDSWQCRIALLEGLLIEGRSDEAISLLHGISDLPDDLDERVIAARAFGLINPADGLPVLDEILAASPDHAAAHFEKAFLSHRAGDIETAKVNYYRAIALEPILADAKFEGKLLVALSAGGSPQSSTDSETKEDRTSDPGEVPAEEEGEKEENELFFPAPGEIPVMTLRQAIEAEPAWKGAGVAPNPRSVALQYEWDSNPRPMVFTRAEEYFGRFRKIRLLRRGGGAPVDYDFRHPDETLFEGSLSPDRILVGAPVTEEGVPVASLRESLQRHQRILSSKIVRSIRKNKVQSLVAGFGVVLALVVSMTLFSLGIVRTPPPQIVAQTAPGEEEVIETREILRDRVRVQPASEASASMSTQFLRSAAASSIAVPSFDAAGTGLGFSDLGAHFGAGMNFGGSGNMFFGTKVRGRIAVVFDVTGSMYSSIPIVIQEIEDHFRNAHVVAVHGSKFTDEGPDQLTPYKANRSLQDMVDGYSGFSGANELDKALRRLRRCDSLKTNLEEEYLQSVGRALELLMKKKSAQSIFVFSDFQDGEDKGYLREMAELARRSGIRVVFHHPVSFADRATRRAYQAFVDEARGEVKEGGLGRRR